MNGGPLNPEPFQLLVTAFAAAAIVLDSIKVARGAARPRNWLIRCAIWLAVTAAVHRPDLVERVAGVLGIGRGADVVLYLFVVAFLATSFYFLSRYERLQSQVTELVRLHAIDHARRGGESAAEGTVWREDVAP